MVAQYAKYNRIYRSDLITIKHDCLRYDHVSADRPVLDVSPSTISRLGNQLIPAKAHPPLDADTERAVRVFMGRVSECYPVDRAILFGSCARRTHTADSDADIAVVLKGQHGKRSTAAIDMAGIAFDVMLETGILVEALPLWRDEMEQPERFNNPALIKTIQREGVAL